VNDQSLALEILEVSKSFAGLKALSRVSLNVLTGETIGLIGQNGAGKTTLFNVISGSVTPDSGTIRYKNQDIIEFPVYARARFGLVRTFQTPRIFGSLTCIENVMAGAFIHCSSRSRARDEAEWALRVVGVEPPWDYSAQKLNLETRRLVEIARLLATRARLVLLDEPMAGLTLAEIDRVCGAIRELRRDQGMTFVIIEHHINVLMRLCDRLVALHLGEKIAEGSAKDVAEDPIVREVYLGFKGGGVGTTAN
jgi:branched-chain amino acid transport system ATP-binding protein